MPGGVTEILNTVLADDGSEPLAVDEACPCNRRLRCPN